VSNSEASVAARNNYADFINIANVSSLHLPY